MVDPVRIIRDQFVRRLARPNDQRREGFVVIETIVVAAAQDGSSHFDQIAAGSR